MLVETSLIPIRNREKFINWFENHPDGPGTEWEENIVDDNYTTFILCDLSPKEFKKTQSFLETCGEITWDEYENLTKGQK